MRRFCEKLYLSCLKLYRELFPAVCPVCRETTTVDCGICSGCLALLKEEEKRVCPQCRQIAPLCACPFPLPIAEVPENRTWFAHTFYNAYEDGVLCRMLHHAKKEYNRTLFSHMAHELAEDLAHLHGGSLSEGAVAGLWKGWTITWIPRSPDGYRRYGFDQGEKCAERIGKYLHIPASPLFFRHSGKMQKSLNAGQRRENIAETLHLRADVDIPTGPILLYDDVMTTGASMEAAVLLLAEVGVTKVFPVTYARTVRNGVRVPESSQQSPESPHKAF